MRRNFGQGRGGPLLAAACVQRSEERPFRGLALSSFLAKQSSRSLRLTGARLHRRALPHVLSQARCCLRAAGEVGVALRAVSRGSVPLSLDSLQTCFPHSFDKFQKRALKSVLTGHSVVVCAPTGSGKTLVAEAGIIAALAAGKRAFYTTPLKALSNQKLREFRARFGAHMVGLKTGDAAVNPEARIVVMTTEILRNMLYRSAGGSTAEPAMADVGLVVLDEVHYMADAERGTVWEECIIYCPPSVPLLCLSATVGNPDDLQGWVSQVHGTCELVTSGYRPVPLNFAFAKRGGDDSCDGWPGLGPLLSRRGDRLNRVLEERDGEGGEGEEGARFVSSWRRSAPPPESVLRHLSREALLPAVWFIFSRKRCDDAVMQLSPATAALVTSEERARLAQALAQLQAACPEAVRPSYGEPLLNGVAAHHAGCLPAWKALVEELFQQGLLKVVFATETLAAGINMPARSVVLSALSKRDSEGPRRLTVNEFMQMAGRAGRRGYDTQGTVVVVQSPFEGAPAAAELALGEPEALVSRFAVSYGMALNLMRNRSLSEVQAVMSASFGNYLRSLARAARGARLEGLQAELQLLRSNMSPKTREAEAALASISKLRGTLQEERRALKALMQQLGVVRGAAAAAVVEDGAPHWLLDRPLPVPVLLRLVPGGPSRARAAPAGPPTSRGWGAVAADPGPEAGEDELDELDELDGLLDVGSQPGAARVEEELDAASEVVLSAAVLSFDLAPPPEEGWEFLALGADNVWYRGPLDLVVGLGDEWLLAPGDVQAQPPPPGEWEWRAGALRAQGGRASFPSAGRVANALMGVREGEGLPQLPSGDDAAGYLAAARERIEALERQLAAITSNTVLQKNIRKAAARLNRIRALEASAARMGERVSNAAPAGWGDFQNALAVLRRGGAMLDTHELTRLGEAAASVRAQNELWIATALLSGALDGLAPHALAGAVTALLADECISRPNVYAAYGPSPQTEEALQRLAPLAVRLEALQAELAFEVPISLSPYFAGLVESWAAGSDWAQLCRDTSLDEGDLSRLLRRIGEFLGQIGDIPHVSTALRTASREARKLVDRAPISELIG